jgi:peptidoglycan/xylan/chitin deacetylase (PgdA/CDA1 family)
VRAQPAACTAAAAAAAWTLPALAPLAPPLAAALGIATRSAHPDTVALTFDDGPHPHGTPAVLEILRAAGARATFFLVGEQVRRAPALAGEIVAAGHTIALHCDRHRNLLRLPPGAVRTDLERAAEAIHAASGIVPTLHRAPYGIYSWPALRAVRAHGWAPVLWSRWARDWRRDATPASIAATAADGIAGGDVVLLHDADDYSVPGSWRATVAALPSIVAAVQARGLRLAALAGPADLAQGR